MAVLLEKCRENAYYICQCFFGIHALVGFGKGGQK
jgi:hypothetical protein